MSYLDTLKALGERVREPKPEDPGGNGEKYGEMIRDWSSRVCAAHGESVGIWIEHGDKIVAVLEAVEKFGACVAEFPDDPAACGRDLQHLYEAQGQLAKAVEAQG